MQRTPEAAFSALVNWFRVYVRELLGVIPYDWSPYLPKALILTVDIEPVFLHI